MGPSKRKGLVRRQVLDLNSKEDSPQRSAWQNKYQVVLPDEEICQNGDSEPLSTVSNNPLSGLLGNYNSDSDTEEPGQKVAESLDAKVEDFLKEIQSISAEVTTQDEIESSAVNQSKSQDKALYLPSVTGWQQCYDHNSGYPYYWNTETNEVTWEMPTELKTTIATVHQHQQAQLQQTQLESNVKKKVGKYPWQNRSDCENEKDDVVASHRGEKESKDTEKNKAGPVSKAPQQSVKIKGKDIKLAPEDPEAMNEFIYETSSLLAHGVQDTGPPGDESFQTVKQTKVSVVKKEEPKYEISPVEHCPPQSEVTVLLKPEIIKRPEEETDYKSDKKKIADDFIPEIKKETLQDCVDEVCEAQIEHSAKTTGIALIANYGDDSEPEDNSFSEKNVTSSKSIKQLFPVEIPPEKVKPLFPCVGTETVKVEIKPKEPLQEEPDPVSNIYNSEFEDPAVKKAFKRKKRIEFATIAYGPSTSKSSDKSPDRTVTAPTTQYNMDPDGNEHHGFGFNAHKAPAESEKKTYKNCGGIQFIKAETINLREQKEKETELELGDGSVQKDSSEGSVRQEEIEYAATLLREKVTFLTAGTDSISAIQQMAIELETLVVAWKDGALTPPYLLRWLNEKCSEITHHEKSAAPAGWTCFWDRKSKRYSYRNVTTKEIQWEYPTAEEKTKGKGGEVDGAGDEMDICDTPPHLSPGGSEKQTDETPNTPPPPVISTASEMVSSPVFTPQLPSPPQIPFCEEEASKKKRKRKADEISKGSEDEGISVPTPTDSEQNEGKAPPLPPMPPPPPPPPEESPPPLPDSPPPAPLPVEPDQPLPPGVDEPECSFFRTPKHSYKKSQPETATFSAELMMTYGYGLPVQQVVSSNGQPITMQMQPVEYHTYMQDAVSNSYVVPSSLTSHVIHCPAKKPKPSLTSELVSFYTDLAKMDNSGKISGGPSVQVKPTATAVTQERSTSPPSSVAPVTTAPKPTSTKTSAVSLSTSVKALESVPSNGVNITKKKKKTKTASGLSLKKKGVSSLVAKWQQVQQEVRRDFSDDDDDDDVDDVTLK